MPCLRQKHMLHSLRYMQTIYATYRLSNIAQNDILEANNVKQIALEKQQRIKT